MSFLTELKETIGNEYASIADDGIAAGDVTGYISSGSYNLNALLGGSLFSGLAGNKITALAGEASTGKTWIAIDICGNFLNENQDGVVVYFESESAVSKDMFKSRGIDTKRVLIVPVITVQEFRTQIIKIIDRYLELTEKQRTPMVFVLDSLGMLSTTKEIEDTAAGKETQDMTRAKVIKAMFRTVTLKLGKAGIPMILTNHTYEEQGLFPKKIMGGGAGGYYSASTIVFLSKRKDKVGTDVIGTIITCTLQKGRLTKENSKCEILLNYDKGMSKYHGLLDLGLKHGIIEKVGNKWVMEDGNKYFEKAIMKDPERFFTQDLLLKLDDAARKEYCYGAGQAPKEDGDEETSDDHTEEEE